ncbi:AAA family ATPase [Erysipelatoclostridium ramosum]|uniref:AAA family ATPase n=1 Tax=Thomasclavelia ramosa TaxID=1547 RepID=UPI0018AC35FC|nr:AAA family ATPase [Thomasclavelia ramosa]MDB7094790.1 AAA family ATPase [Thomasclavelia ramosa]
MKKITVRIEDFKELIDKDYLYIDKSYLINDLLDEKVVLYTRPRRYSMIMLISLIIY